MPVPVLPVIVLAVLFSALRTAPGHAADSGPPRPLPPAAAPCANCHGTDGRQPGAIPAIAGRPAALLGERLRQYRDGTVADATVMPRLIKGLTEAEIDQVSAYFSTIR